METTPRGGPRRAPYETAGTVDHPFDEDRPASHELIQSDAACSIPWVEDSFQAIQVFVDPALRDRAQEICETMSGLSGQHRDLDGLNDAIHRFAERAGLSASVHERPPDDLSRDVVAVAFTIG